MLPYVEVNDARNVRIDSSIRIIWSDFPLDMQGVNLALDLEQESLFLKRLF